MEPLAQSILEFWFGSSDDNGRVDDDTKARWFKKDPQFDALISKKFAEYLEPAVWGAFDRWPQEPAGRVALIILLDQFPRNMYRQDPRAFYFDQKAQMLSLESFRKEEYLTVPFYYGYFSLMPLMHAENSDLQQMCVAGFQKLADQAPDDLQASALQGLDFAKRHQDIIARFGRFPHRNTILGRESSQDELEFLQQAGSSF
jgi:uncharacterized protein (DUF924 family)